MQGLRALGFFAPESSSSDCARYSGTRTFSFRLTRNAAPACEGMASAQVQTRQK